MKFKEFINESYEKVWECYFKIKNDSSLRGGIEFEVSESAEENVIAVLNRGIRHKADDRNFFAEKGDSEWLSSWKSNVESILSDSYYHKATAFYKKYDIAP